MVAQALVAAGATVTDKDPQSLHAYFVEAGTPEQPLELVVDRVRDGRSMSTRRVTVAQGDRPLLSVIASFHDEPDESRARRSAAARPEAGAAPAAPGLGARPSAAGGGARPQLDRATTAIGSPHR